MLISSIARLCEAQDVRTFKEEFAKLGTPYGFGACFIISPISRNNRQGRILNNFGFSPRWELAYRKLLHRFDPMPEIAFRHGNPFRWSEASAIATPSRDEQRYLALLSRLGMSDGIAFPLFGSGARAAVAGFGHHPDLASVSHNVALELHVLLQAAYHLFCRLTARETSIENELSVREKDVLFWLTQGKSNSAIAQILAISPATVDTYLRRVYRKLSVSDRVGAAMAAVQYGYVIPGESRRPDQSPSR